MLSVHEIWDNNLWYMQVHFYLILCILFEWKLFYQDFSCSVWETKAGISSAWWVEEYIWGHKDKCSLSRPEKLLEGKVGEHSSHSPI